MAAIEIKTPFYALSSIFHTKGQWSNLVWKQEMTRAWQAQEGTQVSLLIALSSLPEDLANAPLLHETSGSNPDWSIGDLYQ